jgi:hypothetical protein
MISLTNNLETGNTTISFIILDGNKLVPSGDYEYAAITVDDFLDLLAAISAAIGTALVCTVVEVGTAGLATAACAASVIGTVAAFGKTVT